MSLILEALRKSEADRQIGRAPGLLTPMSTRPQPRGRGRAIAIAGGATLLIVALGAAWWLGRSGVGEDSTVAGSAAVPTPAVATSEPTAPAAPTAIAQTPAPTASAPAARPAVPTSAPKPALPVAGPSDLPSDPEFVSTERESLPLPPPTLPQPAAPIVQTPAPVADAPGAAPTSPAEPDPTRRFATLTEAERAGLPPLRLNMHVFNDDASRRFVMIDGRRLGEGDRISPEVGLLEIRRDGAVLDLRGQRILIERP